MSRKAIFIADLGFGDAGKGTITDYLTRECSADLVVRYNGGPQAAHNVVTADGKHHTFAQFGSGMLLPWTRTLLTRFMLINPLNMLREERHLAQLGVRDALSRTLVDRRALIITPFQKAANRLRELARADQRHGSCGEGIGECRADQLAYGNDVLYAGDLLDRATMRKKLQFLLDTKYAEVAVLREHLPDSEQVRQELATFTHPTSIDDCLDVYLYFARCVQLLDETAISARFAQSETMIFEGAQGVLLDENYAFAPYTTWSTTTFANADTLLQEHNYTGEIIKLGVLRAYATRHGAGPFPTEEPALTAALPDLHNSWNDWQQTFRVGHFDLVATRYARDVIGHLDGLAITHLDRWETMSAHQLCTAYHYQGVEADLSPYFVSPLGQESRTLTGIKVQQSATLTHQEELTRHLWLCRPHYQTLPERSTQEEYLALLAEQLAAPIAIISSGPTEADKRSLSVMQSWL
ncbi:adenylosuccinate synthetase [Reticulibacter mediterranei]|uniref:Adenylosuccinate synthetase n=1 Tax=Reticulibacter mediterranei TaxID=2778369 RepID=A0A8J3IUK8_9CHLR|nr:adenylosuccinate synthetase [Reticulibacter mediterranei]GHO98164.1 adenylosuccinate synthetase [Reticulibacter mediterranei]